MSRSMPYTRWVRHLRGGVAVLVVLTFVPGVVLTMSAGRAQGAGPVPNWAQQTPSSTPGELAGASMAYDSALGEMLLFGGISDGRVSDATYAYNGTAWTLLSPASSPPPIAYASMAYDPSFGEMVLFGGAVNNTAASDVTYFYNGTTWTDADITGPSARAGAAMAYDPDLESLVLTGGVGPNEKILGDTWLLESTGTWYGPIDDIEGGVYGSAMAYDPGVSEMVLFGGVYDNGTGVAANTLTFTPTTGWTQVFPANSPPPLEYASMDYDPVVGDVVLFGGGSGDGLANGTWAFDGSNWSNEAPAASPPARDVAMMAFDPSTNRMLLYGGNDNFEPNTGNDLDDTWLYGTPGTLTQTGPTSDTQFIDGLTILTGEVAASGNSGPVTYTTTTGSQVFNVSSDGLINITDLETGSYTVSGTDSDAFGDTGVWSYTLNFVGSTLYVSSGGVDNSVCASEDPCATLAAAVGVAQSGLLGGQAVTIDVGPGTYESSGTDGVVIDDSSLSSLSIVGAGDATTTLTANVNTTLEALDLESGSLTLRDVTVENPTIGSEVGADVTSFGALTLANDTLSNSYTGVASVGTADMQDDTFTQDNYGVNDAGTATFTNDTFSGDGTGIQVAGEATLVDDTLAADAQAFHIPGGGSNATISDSILDGAPCGGVAPTDGGYNVESDDSCGFGSTDVVNSSKIELSSLAANGSSGPETEAIGATSSALDEVPQAECTVSTDERGDPRPGESGQTNCDAGAYEIQSTGNPQTISFTSTPPSNDHVYAEYIPTATSTSGLPVTITLDAASTGCDLSDGIVYYVGAGTCVIDANQAGDSSYLPALQVQQSIEILLVAQTVSFSTSPPAPAYVGGTYTPEAHASSDDPVTFAIDASSTGCSLSSGVVSFNSAGTCVVDAIQAGNTDYAPAEAQQSFTISQVAQTVSFTSSLPDPVAGGTYKPVASATSGLGVTISLDPDSYGCTLKSGVVHLTTADATCLVDANQAGNAMFAAAPQVQQSLFATVTGLVSPIAVSSDGTHVWVANLSGNAVTELDASTGALVNVIEASSDQFNQPFSISSDGAHVWVANSGGNSVTELDASTGALVKVIDGKKDKFDYPVAVSSDGTHVWVANLNGDSVTELDASTGALVKVIDGTKDKFDGPAAIDSDGTHVWVANQYSNTVTELHSATGKLVKVIDAAKYGFLTPDGVSSNGTQVWVSSFGSDTLTELNASTGALVRTLTGDGLSQPESVSSDGTDVWVTNRDDSMTEVDASNGSLVAVISDTSDPSDDFNTPIGVDSDGSHVWVTNIDGNSVTELDAPSGALVQVISG
ncbi:MAG: choice-of-anchor Q domain-containing protein [Acidimicrobiales bacterium]